MLQVVPVPRQALAAASLAIGPEQDAEGEEGEGGENDNKAPAKLCEKMVRPVFRVLVFCLLRLVAMRLVVVGSSRKNITVHTAACTVYGEVIRQHAYVLPYPDHEVSTLPPTMVKLCSTEGPIITIINSTT